MLDIHGCYELIIATVQQARLDARRDDRDAIIFLNAIDAPESIPGQRRRRVAPYKRGPGRKQRVQSEARQ